MRAHDGSRERRRVGLLGGTFNPPHLGHLLCAQEAHQAYGLDQVLLVPTRTPPHKDMSADPGVAHRVEMCDSAVAGDERFGVSRADAHRAAPAYTEHLLRRLHAERPEDELIFIVGADAAMSLPRWYKPEQVLALARLAVAGRKGVSRADVAKRLAGLAGTAGRISYFHMPRLDISSTLIRDRVAAGLTIRYLVPDAVDAYIERERLYRR